VVKIRVIPSRPIIIQPNISLLQLTGVAVIGRRGAIAIAHFAKGFVAQFGQELSVGFQRNIGRAEMVAE